MIRIIVPLVFTFLWFAHLVLLVARDPDKWTMPGALSSEDLEASAHVSRRTVTPSNGTFISIACP